MKKKAELILALDVKTIAKAKDFVDKLYPKIKIFKVGLELFTGCGPDIIDFLNKKGAEVFLDLKFYDIPNTVASAVRQAVRLRIKMLTLHILGGEEMLKAAIKAADEEAAVLKIKRPLLIGVTVLTSQKVSPDEILKLAKIGIDYGLDGVVCSAQEVALLKREIKNDFFAVTPGIRQANAQIQDQKRVATAKSAATDGSNFLVVGRSILESNDPIKTTNELLGEIS
jgi:orotidine-5'-phosphate decarboxylase